VGFLKNFFLVFFVCLFYYGSFFIFIFIPIFFLFLSILLTLPPSSSHPYCYPLHSPSFSYAKIHSSPSQLLFLPLLIHFLHLPTPSPPILPQPPTRLPLPPMHYHLLTYYTNFTQPQPPAIPDTSTLHYNRNTPKDTQGPQTSADPTQLVPLTYPLTSSLLVSPYPTPQISIASLTNVNPPPTPTAYRYYHQGVFYIIYKLLVGY
jgi:hypothetical protein